MGGGASRPHRWASDRPLRFSRDPGPQPLPSWAGRRRVRRCRFVPDLDLRRLHDGSKFQVVEVLYEPKELESLLGHQGWTARLEATRSFIFGEARLAEGGAPAGPDASHNTR